MSYRPDIDGLRAVAVLAVVAYHAFPGLLPGGFVGVDVFFVISGYLISGIILDWLREDRFTFARFYARRIRRIFPALALVMASLLLIGWFTLHADRYSSLGRHAAGGAAFAANLLLWGEAGYFDTAADTKPLLHLWSLGIEEQFYLAWPALLVLTWRRRVPPLATIGIALAVSLGVGLWTVRVDRIAAFYSPLSRLWELLAGAALAAWGPVRLGSAAAAWASASGLALIGASVVVINGDRVFPGLWALVPTIGTVLLLAAGPLAGLNRALLSARPLVWIGLISYPLYLWHWPMLVLARLRLGETPPAIVRFAIVLGAVVLAAATERWLEHPVRRGRWQHRAVPACAAAMAAVFALGLLTSEAEGFVERRVNRSDRAHFLQYYERLRRHGLGDAYRQECDFMEWESGRRREAIDPSCTEPGRTGTWFLWGDSHAQALSLGLRRLAPAGIRLAQVTTSHCPPGVGDTDPSVPDERCLTANHFALDRIRTLRPDVVVLARMRGHAGVDWVGLATRLRTLGARRVILVGPAPQWHPSLPEVVVTRYWDRPRGRIGDGLDAEAVAVDRTLAASLDGADGIEYLSLIGALCDPTGCVAVVPGTDDLVAVDAGHLSPAGSVFVARTAIIPRLQER